MASMLHLTSEQICLFLEDMRPLSCAASGMVTVAHWRGKAEQLWPGAAANLPGEPKSQVFALCGNAPTLLAPCQQIQPSRLAACGADSSVLLVVKRGNDTLWRGASRINMREIGTIEQDEFATHAHILFADFTLPSEVASSLETSLMQWVAGQHVFRDDLPECDVQCLLQIWTRGLAGGLHVIQPFLLREAIRYERQAVCGFVGTLQYGQLMATGDTCGSFPLWIKTYRHEASELATNSVTVGRVCLQGIIEGERDAAFVTFVRFLANLQNAYYPHAIISRVASDAISPIRKVIASARTCDVAAMRDLLLEYGATESELERQRWEERKASDERDSYLLQDSRRSASHVGGGAGQT